MNNHPVIEAENQEKFIRVLKKLDPDLYIIKIALMETGLDPVIVPVIIRQIGNLVIGTGYGKILINMQAKVITQVTGEESVLVNRKAMKDKDTS